MAIVEVNWHPSNRDLRLFAVAQAVALVFLGWWIHRRPGGDYVAAAIVVGGLVGMIAGVWKPRLLRGVYVAWMLAAFPIGWVMSHLLLAAVYYGMVTPMAIYFRWTGRDLLQLSERQQAESHWIARPETREPSSYFRQF